MSEENPLSAQRLAVLRVRLVRMQLHAEAADLWPGATPSFRSPGAFHGGEVMRAFSQFLQLCRDTGPCIREEIRSGHEARKARSEGKPLETPWPQFWSSAVRYVLQVLQRTLGELAEQWLIDPAPVREELSGRVAGHIDRLLVRGWESHFYLFSPPEEARPRGELPTREEVVALGQWRDAELNASRLSAEQAAALSRCVRHLDEILAHGKDAGDFDDVADVEGDDSPLAVAVPPAGGEDGCRRGMSVRVLGRPKTLKSIPMMDLIVALVESGDFGLSHDEAKRHHSNASKVLNALCREDADWRRAIALPTNGKGGYRVRRLSEVPAERDPEPPTDEVPTK